MARNQQWRSYKVRKRCCGVKKRKKFPQRSAARRRRKRALRDARATRGARPRPPQPQSESLGKQTIEGVEAEGTRTTITIPAGQIGNDRPMVIVSERWYSPDLQTVVMSKHSDPRMGETVFHLTNISRAEPDASLFPVPPDYTLKEGHEPGGREKILMRHPLPPPDGPPPGEED